MTLRFFFSRGEDLILTESMVNLVKTESIVNLVKNKMNLVPRDLVHASVHGRLDSGSQKFSDFFFPLDVLKIVIGEHFLLKFLQYGEKEVFHWMEEFISECLNLCS